MKATRIVAIVMLWLTAPIYSLFPYMLNAALQGGAVAGHGESQVCTGHIISATIASLLLALAFFHWKWKENAGFGWLVIITSAAFGVHLALSCVSDLLVSAFVPGLPVRGEDGSITLHPPQTVPILGQFTSAVLYALTFPLLVALLAVVRGVEHGLSRTAQKWNGEAPQVAAGGNGGEEDAFKEWLRKGILTHYISTIGKDDDMARAFRAGVERDAVMDEKLAKALATARMEMKEATAADRGKPPV